MSTKSSLHCFFIQIFIVVTDTLNLFCQSEYYFQKIELYQMIESLHE